MEYQVWKLLFAVSLLIMVEQSNGRESFWKFNFPMINAGKNESLVSMASHMFADSYVTITVACQSATVGGGSDHPVSPERQKIELSWMLLQVDCAENVYNMNADMVTQMFYNPSMCETLTTTTTTTTTQPTPGPSLGPTPLVGSIDQATTNLPETDPSDRVRRHGNDDNMSHDNQNASVGDEMGGKSRNVGEVKKRKKAVVESYVQFGERQWFSCDSKENAVVVLGAKDEAARPYYKVTSQVNSSECQLSMLNRAAPSTNHTLSHQVTRVWADGKYRLYLNVRSLNEIPYAAAVVVEMRGYDGYLSAREWPMLPVTGLMALFYLLAGTAWIFYWARSQEHTKRIHIVIGIVAVAGAMGSTLSFADYSVRNSDGLGISGIRWIGSLISTLQDSLTYLLLMVVSTGYGINRPKVSTEWLLGMIALAVLNFLTGIAYLIAFDESVRVMYDIIPAAFKLIAAVYAIINILITGWIMLFSIYTLIYLIQRRHSSPRKLRLFTVFMIACVSVFTVQFIMGCYAISQGLFTACRKDWKYEWVSTSLNQLEVFSLLFVLMWLWRPTDENKSYAFRPIETNESLQLDDESADEDNEKIALNEF